MAKSNHDPFEILALWLDPRCLSIEAIAEEKGCSISTVDRAISGYATDSQRQARQLMKDSQPVRTRIKGNA